MSAIKSTISKIFRPIVADDRVLYPAKDIIWGPYIQFIKSFRFFFWPAAVYSLLLSILYFSLGQNLFCSFSPFYHENICSHNVILFIVTRVLAFYLIAAFGVRYYQLQWQNVQPSLKFLLIPARVDVVAFVALVVLILSNLIALWSWQTLAVRVPNPNWKIELIYFAVISCGFLVPIILSRLYVILAFVFSGSKNFSIFKIWQKTRGNGLRILIWFFMFLFISGLFLSFVVESFNEQALDAGWFTIIVGEYVFNFSLLIIFGFFVNALEIQKSYLCKEKEND